jgi:hypothetical protein
MAVNTTEWQKITLIKSFVKLAQSGKHKYRDNLPQHLNPRISRVKITFVIYCGIFFIKLAPGGDDVTGGVK